MGEVCGAIKKESNFGINTKSSGKGGDGVTWWYFSTSPI